MSKLAIIGTIEVTPGRDWLKANFDSIGAQSTIDLREKYF